MTALITIPSILCAAGFLAGCYESSPISPRAGAGPVRSDEVASGFEIVGPQTLAPTQTAQFRVMTRTSIGFTRDSTSGATWSNIGDDRVISVAADGLVTARQTGDGYLAASVEGHRLVSEVIVVPQGTYRLIGKVVERGFDPLDAALIEIVPKNGPKRTIYADGQGLYRVYGVSGEIELRVTKDGYRPFSELLDVARHLSHTAVLYEP